MEKKPFKPYRKQNQPNPEGFIFGIHAITEAINSDKTIDKILFKKGLAGDQSRDLFDLSRELDIPYQIVPEQKLNRITRKNHQGVIAFISPIPFYQLENVLPQLFEDAKNPFLIILDGITDVRNFGAIARSAEIAGVDAIIIPEKGGAQVGPDAVKTSAGALNHIKVCREKQSLKKTIRFLQESGLKVFGASEKSEKLFFECDYSVPTALVMGSESIGLSEEALTSCDELIKIPQQGKVESLNVSVAAGVLLFEVVKQRL